MYRSSSRSLARVARTSQTSQLAGRRAASTAEQTGYAAQTAQQGIAQHQSHLLAGGAGGLAVLLLGYTYYHFSGIKTAVNQVTSITDQAKKLKESAVGSVPDASQAIRMLRSVTQSYAAAIPGASMLVDKAFDQADALAKEHGPEVEKALRDVYDEVTSAIKSGEAAPEKLLQLVVGKLRKLESLASDQLQPLLDSNPQLQKALTEPMKQLRELSDAHGDQAQKLYRDTSNDISRLMAKGVNAASLMEASQLVKKRMEQARQLAEDAGSDAWDRVQKETPEVFANIPDLGKTFESQISRLRDTVGPEGSKVVDQAYSKLREITSSKGSAKDTLMKSKKVVEDTLAQLGEMAKDKAGALATGGAAGASGLLAALPGIDKVPELAELSSLLQKRGPEAEALIKSTVEDLRKVLADKVNEGKKLGEKTAKEAKSTVQK